MVAGVGGAVHHERRARRHADAVRRQRDQRRLLVAHLDPQVDAVGRRPTARRARRGPPPAAAPLGVGRAGPLDHVDRGRVVEQLDQHACSSRLDQPGPSRRRSATPAMTSPAPPTAASRRSGPWLLEKLRMCTVRSGRYVPRLTSRERRDVAGVVVLDRPRPSVGRSRPASSAGPAGRHADARSGSGPGAAGEGDGPAVERRLQRARARCPGRRAAGRSARRRPARAGRAGAGSRGSPPAPGRRGAPRAR